MTQNTPENSPLAQTSMPYRSTYSPACLYPIPRAPKRAEIGLSDNAILHGLDRWNCYEVSWLRPSGRPEVAVLTLDVPASSSHIIESKSLKLYLNSFNQTAFANQHEVETLLQKDLSRTCGEMVSVCLINSANFQDRSLHDWPTANLDEIDTPVTDYQPSPKQLLVHAEHADETLASHLLKSNCLVTGQPDWGSLIIEYTGPRIDRTALLQYIVSFREHNEFHEQCVEMIYHDLLTQCHCQTLSVYAAYTRRGGIDICPFRSTNPHAIPPSYRHFRQ